MPTTMRIAPWVLLAAMGGFLVVAPATGADEDPVAEAHTLLDLSGLTWIEGDLFLGIHDAKDNPKKRDWPRVSLVRLPTSELEGVLWQALDLAFPGGEGPSGDLESAASIPGGRGFLFAESGQEGRDDHRIFHAVREGEGLAIVGHVEWPVPVHNVEAMEVCQVGDELVFLYAERASGKPSTELRWAPLTLEPLAIGAFRSVTWCAVDPAGEGARPIVGLDVDADGWIYSVSAYDSGSDDGPYRSVVWRIGRVCPCRGGGAAVVLGRPQRLGVLDGLKVESVTVRQVGDEKQVFVGTDDEHFGGIIRRLP